MITYGTRINPGRIKRRKESGLQLAGRAALSVPIYLLAVAALPFAWLAGRLAGSDGVKTARNCFVDRQDPPGKRVSVAPEQGRGAARPLAGLPDRSPLELDGVGQFAEAHPPAGHEVASHEAADHEAADHEVAAEPRPEAVAGLTGLAFASRGGSAAREGVALSAQYAAAGWRATSKGATTSLHYTRSALVGVAGALAAALAFYRLCGDRFRDFISIFTTVAEGVYNELADDVRASIHGEEDGPGEPGVAERPAGDEAPAPGPAGRRDCPMELGEVVAEREDDWL